MQLTKRGVLSLIAGAAMMVAAAGGTQVRAQSPEPLSVVATTGMIADAARQVGGDQVTVQALMGPGVDPHAYRQTRTDIVAMINADLVLWHGLFLEAQMQSFMLEMAEQKPVVAVAEAMPKELLIAHDSYADKYDPHVWMDPERWAHVVAAVRDALIAARPEAEAVFVANAERHLAEVKALADYARKVTSSVPEGARVLLTAHDAFNYFGQAHGFEVLGIQGISTESEAGLNRVAELVDLLVDRKIGAVFVESSVSDRNIRALIEGAAAKGHKVVIGGELFSDAMGEEGAYEGTYLGMIDHNVTVISKALGGTVPKGGMRGKLAGS